MIPELIHLGPLPIHSFGLMMVCCFLSAWCCLDRQLRSHGAEPDLAERMVFWAAVGGMVGARVCYLLSFPTEFLRDPLGTIFSGAGFVFYGGFFGGAFAVWILLRRVGRSYLDMADLTGPALAIGYAVGRIGCQLSGDGDYGSVSNGFFAMGYPLGVVPTPAGVMVYPTPVLETVLALFVAWMLLSLQSRRILDGSGRRFGVYLILSGVSRFLVEIIRVEPRVLSWMTQAQIESAVVLMIGLILIFRPQHAATKIGSAAA